MFGRGLTAEQNGRYIEEIAAHARLYTTFAHKFNETAFIVCPTAPPLFVLVQHLLGWGQQRLVDVFRVTQLAQKVGEIIAL